MRVKYAGANLYGQCNGESSLIIDKFINLLPETVEDIEFTHFQVFYRIGHEIFMSTTKKDKLDMLEFPKDTIIAQMSGCESRILFLDKKGQIFKNNCDGSNTVNQLPNFLGAEAIDDCIKQISCGQYLSVALSEQGKLFNLPNLLNFDARNIIEITTGREHCILLDKQGYVYSFGRGSRGQLGHSTLEDENEPKKIEALDGIKIKQVAAGGWHSCAVSSSGDLYTWGWNSNGQMGLESLNVMATPTPVDIKLENNDLIDVSMVACGSKHTVVILEDDRLCGFGWNKYGQLTTIDKENVPTPKGISNDLISIKGIKCGPWSTALLYES